MMRSSTGTKIMVNQQLSSPQILALLADLAPADQKHNFLQKNLRPSNTPSEKSTIR